MTRANEPARGVPLPLSLLVMSLLVMSLLAMSLPEMRLPAVSPSSMTLWFGCSRSPGALGDTCGSWHVVHDSGSGAALVAT